MRVKRAGARVLCVRLALVPLVTMSLVGASLVAVPPSSAQGTDSLSVEELASWAREMVAAGRAEQLRLRFEPLVESWNKASRNADALALLEVWARLEPSSARAWEDLGEQQLQAQAFADARRSYGRAVDLKDSAAAHLGMALSAWELGEIEDAEGSFEAAMSRRPSGVVRYQWARFLFWRGEGPRAYSVADALPSELKEQPEVALLLARACGSALGSGSQKPGQQSCTVATSVSLFEKAVELLPEHAEVRYGLARAYLRAGERKRAREQMDLFRMLMAQDQESGRRRGSGER